MYMKLMFLSWEVSRKILKLENVNGAAQVFKSLVKGS
jgi:hypothetical protein